MIPRHPFACAGRDQGVQLYEQLMLEWQEHLGEDTGKVPDGPISEPSPRDDFIADALSIFDPPTKSGDGG